MVPAFPWTYYEQSRSQSFHDIIRRTCYAATFLFHLLKCKTTILVIGIHLCLSQCPLLVDERYSELLIVKLSHVLDVHDEDHQHLLEIWISNLSSQTFAMLVSSINSALSNRFLKSQHTPMNANTDIIVMTRLLRLFCRWS